MSENLNVPSVPLKRTPLYQDHVDCGGRMVAFAGYEMPVQYATGILEEHTWTRTSAGLFDISHMGEAYLIAEDGRYDTVAEVLETLVPADILGLRPGQQRYSQLLNGAGGIIDDIMVTRFAAGDAGGRLLLILNASRKDVDCAHIASQLPAGLRLELKSDRALLALQGPKAAAVFEGLAPGAAALPFMHASPVRLAGIECHVSRSGYTGEDGFEISLPSNDVQALWQRLLQFPQVRPCGLGARDSLRLEAGLCLYGHELDETTSPVEAGLLWSIQKRRREAGGFPGFARIKREITEGPPRIRVGLLPDGKAPAREGTPIQSEALQPVGIVTSGGYSPTLKRPVAMGYVTPGHAAKGCAVRLIVRGNPLSAQVVALPFVPHGYRRTS